MLALLVTLAPVSAGAAKPSSAEIDAVAAQLRCVVCQTLSVADSPSEMARQMRDVVAERLAAGETPEQVKAYFVSRYGEWVLLSPPRQGFALVAWALPLAALVVGLIIAVLVLARWSRRGAAGVGDPVDEEALATVRREIGRRAQ